MNAYSYILLVPLLPLATFLLLGLFGKTFSRSAGIIGSISIFISAIISAMIAWQYFFFDNHLQNIHTQLQPIKFSWLNFGNNMSVDMGIILDPISIMMIVIVTVVSLMVHIFSLGYMKGEKRFATYYSFLSLFTFSMLALVLSTNLLQVYIFWELVGVSSFLLIGFYFDRPSAVAAAKKAFIVTRFADFGFLIGILILGFYGGSLDIATLTNTLSAQQSVDSINNTTATFAGVSVLTLALSLIFIGGAGKSAMFPLHIWLPDAMEGPTPVSALIHAATMVVAGVYLVARLFPIFSLDITVMEIIKWVGAASALIAAIIACTQTDIKRVLAYSTMSQIGYMMFALGVSSPEIDSNLGYTASLFHLLTHAFFKSLLFLAAGVIIHKVASNNLDDMGGLRKLMPLTHIVFLIGCLAIAGIPPFAGFFSKEEILFATFRADKAVFTVAMFTAMLTAFYMFRLYFSIFWNKQPKPIHTHHDATFSMKLPLVILASLSIIAGFIPFGKFISADRTPLNLHMDLLFSIAPVGLSLLAIGFAWLLYKNSNEGPQYIAEFFGGIYRMAIKKFYVDEVYSYVTKKIIFNLFGRTSAWIDRNIVDGFFNGMSSVTMSISSGIKTLQSGRTQHYAFVFFAGIAGFVLLFIYFLK